MKSRILFLSLLLAPFCFNCAGYAQIFLTNEGKITFVSDAPLELITASTETVQGALNVGDNRFVFKIDNKSFIGFNSPLQQEHFYENYIETEKYKYSTFQGKVIENIDLKIEGPQQVRAKGILSIHGVEQERIIEATIESADNMLLLKSDFQVPLEDHNIRIPNVVYQKIAEVIQVSVRAQLVEKTDK